MPVYFVIVMVFCCLGVVQAETLECSVEVQSRSRFAGQYKWGRQVFLWLTSRSQRRAFRARVPARSQLIRNAALKSYFAQGFADLGDGVLQALNTGLTYKIDRSNSQDIFLRVGFFGFSKGAISIPPFVVEYRQEDHPLLIAILGAIEPEDPAYFLSFVMRVVDKEFEEFASHHVLPQVAIISGSIFPIQGEDYFIEGIINVTFGLSRTGNLLLQLKSDNCRIALPERDPGSVQCYLTMNSVLTGPNARDAGTLFPFDFPTLATLANPMKGTTVTRYSWTGDLFRRNLLLGPDYASNIPTRLGDFLQSSEVQATDLDTDPIQQ